VRLRPGEPEMTVAELEEMIVDEVKAVRQARRAHPHDD
jgi:hypothetical protein